MTINSPMDVNLWSWEGQCDPECWLLAQVRHVQYQTVASVQGSWIVCADSHLQRPWMEKQTLPFWGQAKLRCLEALTNPYKVFPGQSLYVRGGFRPCGLAAFQNPLRPHTAPVELSPGVLCWLRGAVLCPAPVGVLPLCPSQATALLHLSHPCLAGLKTSRLQIFLRKPGRQLGVPAPRGSSNTPAWLQR